MVSREDEEEERKDAIEERFPTVPRAPVPPEPPRIDPILPPHPETRRIETGIAPGSYNKMALAATAASSFIMPIILLALGGYWLDGKLHTAPWLVFIGLLLGLAAGVTGLLRVAKRLSE